MEEQQFDKIESYLDGQLSGAALTAFEQQLQTDSTLAAMTEEHRIAHNAIELLIEEDLRKELAMLREEEATVPAAITPKVVQMPERTATAAITASTPRRRSLFPRLAAAASIILLIGFFTLQYTGNSSSVLDQHFTEYPMPEINRSGKVTDKHPLASGLNDYKIENYEEAIRYFQSIPVEDQRYNEAQFYLGHSFYKNKEYTAASNTYRQLVQSGDIRFLDKAEWYQLRSLIAANQQKSDQFTNLLNKMINDKGHPYHQKAKNLKADL